MLKRLLLLSTLLVPGQDSKPTAEQCSADAWKLVPTYVGDHRAYLSPTVAREVQAAVHLLEAAVTLEPENLQGLWRLGHAESLLAEDCRNRGRAAAAHEHFQRALQALERSLELAPDDPWASYATGMAYTSFGEHERALEFIERAVDQSKAKLNEAGEPTDVAWLRFKAMEWRGEVLMRAQRSEQARDALRAFHTEFSENAWPMHIALAESYEREWDLDGARKAYESCVELFPEDDQAHALLGYIEGLLGHEQLATDHLQRAISLERSPSLYSRLWLVILATAEVRAEAEADLRDLLDNPPGSISSWDLALGRFMLGEGSASAFVAAGEAEVKRRIDVGEAVDDLLCEVYFYAGLRVERDAAKGQVMDASDWSAVHSYRLALQERPIKWKWEWAYSRLFLAGWPEADDHTTSSFVIDGEQFRSAELKGTLSKVSWSVPRSAHPQAKLERGARMGDLLMATVVDADGRTHSVVRVVGGS